MVEGAGTETGRRRRRLIEVAFPLDEISDYSPRDKYLGAPHPQTLHTWWARRPLPACRAFIYASLVDDPEDDGEREGLLKEVADLASWDAVRNPEQVVRPRADGGSGLTGTELLERARRRILASNGGKAPRLLDPFAGGGAIPLEGLRLGCEVEASDLNPVAVLILKGTVEYPQKYGQPNSQPVPAYIEKAARPAGQHQQSFGDDNLLGRYVANPLTTDVRYWGNWMLERARAELVDLYPADPDGSVPVAYLWSRTVPCPNCGAEMPLIRQYWLARKDKKKVALQPVIDRENQIIDFEVVEGPEVTGDPAEATTSRGDTKCLLCGQVVKAEYVRQSGRAGKLGARMTAVVLEADGKGGKRYRADTECDLIVYDRATKILQKILAEPVHDLPAVPDEPIDPATLGLRIDRFGLESWGSLFNSRQLVVLTTFAGLVREAHAEMLRSGLDADYARAVVTYLAFVIDRVARESSTLTRWNGKGEKAQGALGLQAISMVWDFAELNPWAGSVGDARTALDIVIDTIEFDRTAPSDWEISVEQRDARSPRNSAYELILTDPPYYNSIDYAGLSDFFYVWLKRSIPQNLYADLFSMPLTPKKEQAIMASESGDLDARLRYVSLMQQAFQSCAASLDEGAIMGVVFAHTDPDAWATLIEGLLQAGLIPDASWPIDSELPSKVSAQGQARLKTSLWMACRPREVDAGDAFLGDVLAEMRPVIRERLLYFWSKGIRGADFFISAIGPALSVFGRWARVLRPDGEQVSVRDFLDLVRRAATDVALEQVLSGADLGVIDPVTRHHVTWVWSYSRAPLDTGEAIALCLATGADYGDLVRPGSIAVEERVKSKKVARLRTIRERGAQDEHFGFGTAARPAPLIDQLQYAALLWSQNQTGELGRYRGELGETRWEALRTLGQAVAECLPSGDEDRRLINGLLGSNVVAIAGSATMSLDARGRASVRKAATQPLPGMEDSERAKEPDGR